MKDYSQLKEVLNKRNIGENDQELIYEFLSSFTFQKRRQLMGIFLGLPEKISLFIDLTRKKMEFEKNHAKTLSTEILDLENKEIKNLMKELE